jgi:CBS domain-containing protein
MNDSIRDVMNPWPEAMDADATVAEAAQVMREENIGDVIVVDGDEEDRLCGILTDRDIVVRALAEGLDPTKTRIGDICSRNLTTVSADHSIDHALRVMQAKAIRRLPVEKDGQMIGMLTIGDIAGARDAGSALADISAAPPNI